MDPNAALREIDEAARSETREIMHRLFAWCAPTTARRRYRKTCGVSVNHHTRAWGRVRDGGEWRWRDIGVNICSAIAPDQRQRRFPLGLILRKIG